MERNQELKEWLENAFDFKFAEPDLVYDNWTRNVGRMRCIVQPEVVERLHNEYIEYLKQTLKKWGC